MNETNIESLIDVRRELQQVVKDARVVIKSLQARIDAATQLPPSIMPDPVWGLLSAHCYTTNDRHDFVSRKLLYALYLTVCDEKSIKHPCGPRKFRARLRCGWREMPGHEGQHRELGRGYRGLKIKAASMLAYSLEYS